MSKAGELKTTTAIVRKLLEEDVLTRNCDEYLYLQVCLSIDKRCLTLPFPTVILHRKDFGYPPFESVRRCRQKLQESYPELAGDSTTEAYRKLHEETFRNYARGIV